jgi:hypothetical protein
MAFQWLTPQLAGAVNLELSCDKREDRPVMIAVGRAGEAPPSPWVEVVLAHEPADLLAVDGVAAVTELGADPAIAVAFEDLGDRPDPGDDLGLRRLSLGSG